MNSLSNVCNPMTKPLLLRALNCENFGSRPPIWLMRQAGRYMPSYQKLRKTHSLWSLFHTPELAAEVTLLPIELGVDAAILFSDILVVAEMLGKKIVFPEKGAPYVDPPLENAEDVENLPVFRPEEKLHYVQKSIEIVRPLLEVPLIGFCGGPLTLASYMIEQGGKNNLTRTKAWIQNDPKSFHALLAKLTTASIDYLKMKIAMGVDAVQIFDSWAGLLSPEHFQEFSCRYLQQIVDALRPLNIPVLLFCRGSCVYHQYLTNIAPHGISFDAEMRLKTLRDIVPKNICVQGNIPPEVLAGPASLLTQEVKKLLTDMQGEPGFIANLAHGVLPHTPVENVKLFVELVKEFSYKQ
jgi:uroporphyrinogen decarboxylase